MKELRYYCICSLLRTLSYIVVPERECAWYSLSCATNDDIQVHALLYLHRPVGVLYNYARLRHTDRHSGGKDKIFRSPDFETRDADALYAHHIYTYRCRSFNSK